MSGSQQIDADVQMFTETLQESAAASKKGPAGPKAKAPKVDPPLVIPQVDDSEKKAAVLRKITSYMQEFPQRLQGIKIPKTAGERASLEELKMLLADVEHELGKSGSFDYVKQLFVKACEGVEKFNEERHILPYNLTHLGEVAVIQANDFRLEDGTVQHGEMVPLLKEISIKYGDWFSSRVEMRFLVAMAGLMSTVHKINTEAPAVAQKANTKKASGKSAAAAKNL